MKENAASPEAEAAKSGSGDSAAPCETEQAEEQVPVADNEPPPPQEIPAIKETQEQKPSTEAPNVEEGKSAENQPEVAEEKPDQPQEPEREDDAKMQPPEEAETPQENADSAKPEDDVLDATPAVTESDDVSAPVDACADDVSANTAANGPIDSQVLLLARLHTV